MGATPNMDGFMLLLQHPILHRYRILVPINDNPASYSATTTFVSMASLAKRFLDLIPGRDIIRPYLYPPLKEHRDIRTIGLLNTTGNDLECILHHGRLDGLQYKCLSYVWGKPEISSRIIVRDQDSSKILGYIPLTKNLYSALKDIRDTTEVDDKTLWVDQISIHQEDSDEKGRQVELMGEIYRHALAVIMHIGPAAAHDAEGIKLIRILYDHLEPCIQPILDMSWYMAYRRSKPLPVEHLPKSVTLNHPGWPGLLDMAFGTWTERSWIVQENVVNPNTFMLRGQKKLDWICVATMLVLFGVELLPLELLREIRESGRKKASLDCYIDAVSRSLEIKFRKSRPSVPAALAFFLSLCENLEWYDALECADSRDHIYSIMALSTDRRKLGLVPNYNIPVQEVYIDATVRMLTTDESIHHFHYVSLLDNLSDPLYPSWSLTPKLLGRQHFLDHVLYAAHPFRSTVFRFDSKYSELTVRGHIFDRITFASPGNLVKGSTFWAVPELENATRLVMELSAFALTLKMTSTTRQNISQLLISIIAEKYRNSPESRIRNDPVLSLWCYLRISWLVIARNYNSLPEYVQDLVPSIEEMINNVAQLAGKEDHPGLTEEELEIGNMINGEKITYGRSFGVTEQNRIVNFTFKASVGDSLALLQGGRLPFVLRQARDKFQFVGDVCVPGLMYGEAYKGLPPENIDREICLI
ncbi:MAG: hypothetical protein M1822_007398 [Bathelium mastoideum]|nr:MAG: hypothetical protein M1822_007398 [Bathelium mastoideum]